ncbi:hypothetical protein MNBD_GAMMA19-693 [hydrothermal vent metagenome]|uniref:DNA (cytosine-5-)-methyltransferase n=1 Tax=hydrothermal vent metagenome TaxID=652676 RepID=A0A3B1B369_9ZZZZ
MNFVEFFAGVGLVREGLSPDGWECVWANDISQDKKDTYVKNYGENDFFLDDVWNVVKSPALIPDSAFLYTASFPCTDLSVAGGRAGLAGSESGTLNAVLEIISLKKKNGNQPKVVLLENVKGFLTSHQGKDVANTVKIFSALGYYVDLIELDAYFFTPQSRSRVFLVAVDEEVAGSVMCIKEKNRILTDWWSIFDRNPDLRSVKVKNIIKQNESLNWGIFDIPTPHRTRLVLGDIIETDIDEDSSVWWNDERKDHLFNQMSDSHQTILNGMAIKQCYSYGTVYRRMRKGKSTAELRTDGVAGCLRTPRGGSSKQILIRAGYDGWRVRLLTSREYARLQGVRDDFILPENANKGYFAMGDAVCVPVIQYLSNNVLTPLFNKWEMNTSNGLDQRC